MMKKVKAIVMGRVQGVWFRANTMQEAKLLGVRGYARNLPDGSVEIVAEGEAAAVDTLIAWAGEGPPLAVVRHVRVEDLDYDDEFSNFGVRH
ncbi:MAG: acylphosphatase [Thermoanaerobaculia bacterium]|jgi:acylphosphatase